MSPDENKRQMEINFFYEKKPTSSQRVVKLMTCCVSSLENSNFQPNMILPASNPSFHYPWSDHAEHLRKTRRRLCFNDHCKMEIKSLQQKKDERKKGGFQNFLQ